MSAYIRPVVEGATVFFTVALADRKSDLLVREVARLRAAVRVTQAERPFDIAAWVVLPDHLHAMWRLPQGDADFATRWRLIKGRFSHGLDAAAARSRSKAGKAEKGLWQRRYWDHHIRDQRDFEAHVRYCWFNPVKHGVAGRAVDWPYSSIHRDIGLGVVEPEWAGVAVDGDYGE